MKKVYIVGEDEVTKAIIRKALKEYAPALQVAGELPARGSEKRRLFLFYLPPYSPHLNLAETLWRIMKTKWIRPQDYASSDNLFYTVNRALAAVGDTLGIKLKHNAA